MVIGLFGESCTGKSSVAELLKKQLGAQFYSGKDYLRLAKKPPDAERSFAELLREHVDSDDCIIYVLSEKHQPCNATRRRIQSAVYCGHRDDKTALCTAYARGFAGSRGADA